MRLTDLFMDLGRPVAYYPKLTAITGGVKETIFLCQLLYWESKQHSKDRWIYKTQAELTEETGLSRYEQETARRNLKRRGFLEEKLAGIPATLHFRVNLDRVNDAWEQYIAQEKASMREHHILDCGTSSGDPQFVETPQTTVRRLHKQQWGISTDNSAEIPQTITETTTENTQETTTERLALRAAPTEQETQTVEAPTDEQEVEASMARGGRAGEFRALDKPSKFRQKMQEKQKHLGDTVASDPVAEVIKRVVSTPPRPRPRRKEPVKNANTMLAYFQTEFKETFGGIAPLDTGKDRKLLKMLIDHYGYDTVEAMMSWMFKNWAIMRRENKKLNTTVPTIGIFFGWKDYLYGKLMSQGAPEVSGKPRDEF